MTTPLMGPEADTLTAIVAAMRERAGELYGCRSEHKFVVEPQVAEALRAAVAALLPIEQWTPGRQRTLIHSLYFDMADFELYRRSLIPEAMNLKLRLRTYGDAATPGQCDPNYFLEAKVSTRSPSGERIKRKARMGLSETEVATLVGTADGAGLLKPGSRRRFWRPLLGYMVEQGIRPRLTVSYVREAFMGTDDRLRVTFDEGYHATSVADGLVSPLMQANGTLGDRRIVEIKFIDTMPPWLVAELVRLGLPPEGQSFSKFKTAVPLVFPAAAS